MEDPVHAVLVVGGREYVRNDQFSPSGNDHGVVAEISMFEQDSGILLVDANGILDHRAGSSCVDERSIHVVYGSLAIATKRQTVCHISTAVLAQIERMFTLMWVFGVSIRNNHLCQREAVKDRSNSAIVVEGYIVQNDSFSVVESHMDIPLLPVDNAAVNLERNPFRLSDIYGFHVVAVSSLLLNSFDMIILRWCFADWSADWRNIDVDELLGLCVVDGTEVKWIRVLAVVDIRPIIHQRLLQTDLVTEPFIISDRPSYFS